ncbi:SdpI family protein [Bacillus sp. FJAT-27245]|uniref:SdpI family protein n=1 Tax=Bacillus sp. FJAT-27245 TaxID=1684144 RepID=UPI0006A7CC33|nr:SdpI family protein [Bacillus sp. FJAT-27245]
MRDHTTSIRGVREVQPLLIGCIFLVAGLVLFIFPPREMNNIYGYRTQSSKRNIGNWKAANKLASKLLILFGAIICIVAYLTSSYLITIITMIILGIAIFVIVELRLP